MQQTYHCIKMSDLGAAYIIFHLKIKQPFRTNQNKTPHGLEAKDKWIFTEKSVSEALSYGCNNF